MRTIWWDNGKVKLINQKKLPNKLEIIECKTHTRLIKSIKNLEIRGAPAIGIATAMALALSVKSIKFKTKEELTKHLNKIADEIKLSRPTAENLYWAIDRIFNKINIKNEVEEIKNEIINESQIMAEEDIEINKSIGTFGADLINDGDSIGTICNAGWLATAGEYGTALGVIKVAHQQGKKISVIALETRPILQGARLTSFELKQDGIKVKVVPDGAIGYCLSKGMIDKFIGGADRIVVQDDCCIINKIGTLTAAIALKHYKIPFYVAAPFSSFDLKNKLNNITIEERNPNELINFFGHRIIAKDVAVFNPAFDITPSKFINAIFTEKGIIRSPFKHNFFSLLKS